MIFAYFINGFSFSLLDAQANGFVTCLRERASLKMGLIHAFYGAGALFAPIIATQFAPLKRWSLFYLVSLGLSAGCMICFVAIFRLKHQRGELSNDTALISHQWQL